MSATPHAYPLLARLRYAYFEAGRELPVIENAWWESRWDGGRVLGAVVEAMNHPRCPHRLRVHLRLSPTDVPVEMKLTLMRMDGEGESSYRFDSETVEVEGLWKGEEFVQKTSVPHDYTVAPYCMAADGLHFKGGPVETVELTRNCYLVHPQSSENPLMGRPVSFFIRSEAEEPVEVNGQVVHSVRYSTGYLDAEAPLAEYWVTPDGYPLRMKSHRRNGDPVEIACVRFSK